MNDNRSNDKVRARFRGTLLGGAVGDALGYAVEFSSEESIFSRFGERGVTEYVPDPQSGLALISDDTQMTLFTCHGILRSVKTGEPIRRAVALAYADWLNTQMTDAPVEEPATSLMNYRELYDWRAPGNTCLSAMSARRGQINAGLLPESFLNDRLNNSKGCGGVMRAAPIGLLRDMPMEAIELEAAEISAVTHGHPLGYLPSAMLAHIVHRAVYNDGSLTLKHIVCESIAAIKEDFKDEAYAPYLAKLISLAVELSENDDSDLENVHLLGEGWVGEEALAIAVYCALRHSSDFSAAVIAAVNHKGDSDSTGAVAGNIIGAYLGEDAIGEEWREALELKSLMIATADELFEALS